MNIYIFVTVFTNAREFFVTVFTNAREFFVTVFTNARENRVINPPKRGLRGD